MGKKKKKTASKIVWTVSRFLAIALEDPTFIPKYTIWPPTLNAVSNTINVLHNFAGEASNT